MFEVARFAARDRARSALALTALLSAYVAAMIALFPSVKSADIDLDAYVASLPPGLREALGVATLSTAEGFLAAEFYQFAWVLLFGLYLAYAGGRLVAAEVESRRLDWLLAAPVPRGRLLVERYLSVLPLVVAPNLVVPAVVLASVAAIGETVAVERLFVAHLLSVPYLLACAALGLAFSTATDRTDVAQRAALVTLFGLFLLDSATALTDFARLGALSPTRHYDPAAVLVAGEYDWTGGAVLLLVAAALVLASRAHFRRRDVAG